MMSVRASKDVYRADEPQALNNCLSDIPSSRVAVAVSIVAIEPPWYGAVDTYKQSWALSPPPDIVGTSVINIIAYNMNDCKDFEA